MSKGEAKEFEERRRDGHKLGENRPTARRSVLFIPGIEPTWDRRDSLAAIKLALRGSTC